jgi:hypothetical protein
MKVTGPLVIPPDLALRYREALSSFRDAMATPAHVRVNFSKQSGRQAPSTRDLTRGPNRLLNLDAAEARELDSLRQHLRVQTQRGTVIELSTTGDHTYRLTIDDPAAKRPKKTKKKKGHQHRFTLGDKSISRAAMEAAGWLASRWPSHVRQVGTQQFIADRYNEIRHKQFPAPYWTEATKDWTRVCRWGAASVLSPTQPAPPYYDPTRRRSRVTYEPQGSLYPLAAADGSDYTPFPGFHGRTTSAMFYDVYHAAQVDDFELPRRYWIGDNPPLFLIEDANIEGIADGHPPKTMVSTYHHSVIYHEAEPLANELPPIAIKRRRYNWRKQFARQPAGPYAYARHHVHTVDASIKAAYFPVDDHCTRLRVFHAPAAAMGTYYGGASEITTTYQADVTCYMAEREPAEPQAAGEFSRVPFYRATHKTINPRIEQGAPCGYTAWINTYSHLHPFDLTGRDSLPQLIASSQGYGAASVLLSHNPSAPPVDLWTDSSDWNWVSETEGYCPVFGTNPDGTMSAPLEIAYGWWLVTEASTYEHGPGRMNWQRLADTYVRHLAAP